MLPTLLGVLVVILLACAYVAGVARGRSLSGMGRRALPTPRCTGCRHPRSFHTGGTGDCCAVSMGERCQCRIYDGPVPYPAFYDPPLPP